MQTKCFKKRDYKREFTLKPNFEDKVAIIKFYPSLNPQIIDAYINSGYRGIILEGTGLGHISHNCLDSIKKGLKKGIIIGMASQCIWGRVNMNVYTNGRDLLALGVLPLGDMLSETALVKLMWALGQTNDVEKAKALLQKNFSFEFSARTVAHAGLES